MMNRHGIGTDATIAAHITTIQDREYAGTPYLVRCIKPQMSKRTDALEKHRTASESAVFSNAARQIARHNLREPQHRSCASGNSGQNGIGYERNRSREEKSPGCCERLDGHYDSASQTMHGQGRPAQGHTPDLLPGSVSSCAFTLHEGVFARPSRALSLCLPPKSLFSPVCALSDNSALLGATNAYVYLQPTSGASFTDTIARNFSKCGDCDGNMHLKRRNSNLRNGHQGETR